MHQRPERRLRQLFLRPDLGRQLELLRPILELVLRGAEHHPLLRGEPDPRLLRRLEHLQLRHLVLRLLHRHAVRVQLHDGHDLERHTRLRANQRLLPTRRGDPARRLDVRPRRHQPQRLGQDLTRRRRGRRRE